MSLSTKTLWVKRAPRIWVPGWFSARPGFSMLLVWLNTDFSILQLLKTISKQRIVDRNLFSAKIGP